MIPYIELRTAARSAGVPVSTIERDYVQGWLLAGLPWDGLVLKGGTAIRKAYIPDYRFSDDLDFTLTAPLGPDEIQSLVDVAVDHAKAGSGILLEEAKPLKEVENGFVMALRFKLRDSPYDSIRLKLDFTKSGNEPVLMAPQDRPLLHRYTDNCTATIRTYSLVEMTAEKIRSLFQRTRARDLYDVRYILGRKLVEETVLRDILGKKCLLRQVPVDIVRLRARRTGYRDAWKASLAHQMNEVPDFDAVFDWVVAEVAGFEECR